MLDAGALGADLEQLTAKLADEEVSVHDLGSICYYFYCILLPIGAF